MKTMVKTRVPDLSEDQTCLCLCSPHSCAPGPKSPPKKVQTDEATSDDWWFSRFSRSSSTCVDRVVSRICRCRRHLTTRSCRTRYQVPCDSCDCGIAWKAPHRAAGTENAQTPTGDFLEINRVSVHLSCGSSTFLLNSLFMIKTS